MAGWCGSALVSGAGETCTGPGVSSPQEIWRKKFTSQHAPLESDVPFRTIFLADKIEPNTRDKEYAAVIRSYLEEENGLNKALLKCYKETIKSLVKRDLKICLLTIEIYNKLEDLVNV